MTVAGVQSVAAGRCAIHVERSAAGICDRCGSFYCTDCVKQLAGKKLCASCLAIPGIDYLAEAKARAWGKRDGWVWYLGVFGGFGSAATCVGSFVQGNISHAVGTAIAAGLLISYFFMLPWSRKALFAVIPLSAINAVLGAPVQQATQPSYVAGAALASTLIFALFVLASYGSVRNNLAFKIEVSDHDLARYYERYLANPHAGRAIAYGALSIPIPLLIPVGLVFGVHALRKVNANGWPPVGGRSSAVIGLVATGLSTILWGSVIVVSVLR